MKLDKAIPSAMIGLVLAVPVAAWWLIGDLTDDYHPTEGIELDYAYRAVSLGAAADRAVGAIACVGVISATSLMLWATVTRRTRPGWWLVVLPLVAAGLLASYTWRVSTMGVIGANIGAALLTFIGGPIVVVLMVFAAFMARRLYRNRPQRSL